MAHTQALMLRPKLQSRSKHESRPEPQENYLLAALPLGVQKRLFPYLRLVRLPLRSLLHEAGRPMHHAYFPTDSIISIHYELRDGHSTGLALIGNEGLLGMTLIQDFETRRFQAVVQSPGYAFRLPKARLCLEFKRHGALEVLLRFMQAMFSQVSQTAVCNRHHSIDQQLCRWLLMSLDRLGHNRLTMTQEFISHLLGVRREGVTEAAAGLRDAGLISYHRGVIEVLDRPGLELAVCECYGVVRSETERILSYLPQHRAVLDGDGQRVVTLPERPVHH